MFIIAYVVVLAFVAMLTIAANGFVDTRPTKRWVGRDVKDEL